MNKINLKKPLVDFAQNTVIENGKPVILSETIAIILSQGQSENPMKMNSICEKLYETGEIELDESDLEFFRKNVESCKYATDRLRGVVLREISKQRK